MHALDKEKLLCKNLKFTEKLVFEVSVGNLHTYHDH